MTTDLFIIALFCRIDNHMPNTQRHPLAKLYPSEIVTLAVLAAIKGGSQRAFYRWLCRDYKALFPQLPERTRLFRLFKQHAHQAQHFLVQPSLLTICDSYGIELIHPMRQNRSARQIAKKGKSNWRWILGIKLCLLIDKLGRVVAWQTAPANVHDRAFHSLIARFAGQTVVLADRGFHAKVGNPANLKVCRRGQWNERMLIETVFSMLQRLSDLKRCGHRTWSSLQAHLAYTVAAFNLLISWQGLKADAEGFVPLSIKQFAL